MSSEALAAGTNKQQQRAQEMHERAPQGIKRFPDLNLGCLCVCLTLRNALRLPLHVAKQQQKIGKVIDEGHVAHKRRVPAGGRTSRHQLIMLVNQHMKSLQLYGGGGGAALEGKGEGEVAAESCGDERVTAGETSCRDAAAAGDDDGRVPIEWRRVHECSVNIGAAGMGGILHSTQQRER